MNLKNIVIGTEYAPLLISVREGSGSDEIIIREIFEENVYRMHDNFFVEEGVVLDVGANIGVFTLNVLLRAKNNCKPVTIYAIEPEPHNLELLRKNLDQNAWLYDAGRVVIVTSAISDKHGSAYIPDNHGGSSIAYGDSSNKPNIETITLDEFFETYDIDKVSFAKFDIEGSEIPVLLSASDENLDKIRRIALEFDEQNGLTKFSEVTARFARNCQINTLGVPARGCYIYTERFDV